MLPAEGDAAIHYTTLHDQQRWGQTPKDVSVRDKSWPREWYSSLVELIADDSGGESRANSVQSLIGWRHGLH